MNQVGKLDHPESYGAASKAVYAFSSGAGYFILVANRREKLHGNTRWTTSTGVAMRGRLLYAASPRVRSLPERDYDEEEDIDLAIARSLAEMDRAELGPTETEQAPRAAQDPQVPSVPQADWNVTMHV